MKKKLLSWVLCVSMCLTTLVQPVKAADMEYAVEVPQPEEAVSDVTDVDPGRVTEAEAYGSGSVSDDISESEYVMPEENFIAESDDRQEDSGVTVSGDEAAVAEPGEEAVSDGSDYSVKLSFENKFSTKVGLYNYFGNHEELKSGVNYLYNSVLIKAVNDIPEGEAYAVVGADGNEYGRLVGPASKNASSYAYWSRELSEVSLEIKRITDVCISEFEAEDNVSDRVGFYSDEACTKEIAYGDKLPVGTRVYVKNKSSDNTEIDKVILYDECSEGVRFTESFVLSAFTEPKSFIMRYGIRVYVPESHICYGGPVYFKTEGTSIRAYIQLPEGERTLSERDIVFPAYSSDYLFDEGVINVKATDWPYDMSGKAYVVTATYRFESGSVVTKTARINKADEVKRFRVDAASHYGDRLKSVVIQAEKVNNPRLHIINNLGDGKLEGIRFYDNYNISEANEVRDGDIIERYLYVKNDTEEAFCVLPYSINEAGEKEYYYGEYVRPQDKEGIEGSTGKRDLYVEINPGSRLSIDKKDMEGLEIEFAYSTDHYQDVDIENSTFTTVSGDEFVPAGVTLRVKVKGLEGTDKAVRLTYRNGAVETGSKKWYEWSHGSWRWEEGCGGYYFLDDDDSFYTYINSGDVEFRFEKTDTYEVDLDTSAISDDSDYRILVSGKEYKEGMRIADGSAFLVATKKERDYNNALRFDCRTKDSDGEDKAKQLVLTSDSVDYCNFVNIYELTATVDKKGDKEWNTVGLTAYGPLTVKAVKPELHKLDIDMPSGVSIKSDSAFYDRHFICGVEEATYPAGDRVTLETEFDGDGKVYELTDKKTGERLFYLSNSEGYQREHLTMPDRDLELKVSQVETGTLIFSEMYLDHFFPKFKSYIGDYEGHPDPEWDMNEEDREYYEGKYAIPVGEKITLTYHDIPADQYIDFVIHEGSKNGPVFLEKKIRHGELEVSFIMPDKDLVVDKWKKKAVKNSITVEKNGLSSETELVMRNYLEENEYSDVKDGSTAHAGEKLMVGSPRVAENKKLLVKVQSTATNEILTGPQGGSAIDNIKDFIFRMLGQPITISISEEDVKGSGNKVYISESLPNGSSVEYSLGAGDMAAVGDTVTVDVKSVAEGSKVYVNVICPDDNLIASPGGIKKNYTEPVATLVTDKVDSLSFEMPDFPVEINVFEFGTDRSGNPGTQGGTIEYNEEELPPEEEVKPSPVTDVIAEIKKRAEAGYASMNDILKAEPDAKGKKFSVTCGTGVSENVITLLKTAKLTVLDKDQIVAKSFKSLNTSVVKVNKKGLVTAKNVGEAEVTYKVSSGGKETERKLKIRVVAPSASGGLTYKKLKLNASDKKAYSLEMDIPINAVMNTSGATSVLGSDFERTYTKEGRTVIKGTATGKGTASVVFTSCGKKITIKIKVK